MFKRFFCLAVISLLFAFTALAQDNDGQEKKEPQITVITINNARQSAYKKNEENGNECIYLEGAVFISVKKDDTNNDIHADKIIYDRNTEMLYAEGNVEIITKSGNSGNSTATASSLIMNTSTLEGVFNDGRVIQQQSDAVNLPAGSTLIVFSEIFGKGNQNVITFKNSSLTFCDEEAPHWHIDATRTWLLPGGEFAFFNALLYVGAVPVMYFPAFYYPKDELIFNPVFNYTSRAGYSIQTTTYLWGRKPLQEADNTSTSKTKDSTSAESLKAVYNFIRPSTLKEQVREGIVLHNLDEDYKGDSSHYVKIMADWYSNLGYMTGVDGVINPLPGYISRLDFSTYLGFSNTVFRSLDNPLNYYPYSPSGITYKDESSFLGIKMPFRYAANFEFQLSRPFSFSLSLPVYSDPFFSNDFLLDRHETMDWISYLLESSKRENQILTGDDTQNNNNIKEVSSFQWRSTSSYTPSIPAFMRPYLSSLSFSMQNSVSISSKNTTFSYTDKNNKKAYTYNEKLFEDEWTKYTPSRKFYYPSLVTPLSTNINASGTIFQWPLQKENNRSTPSYVIALNKPDELKTEKQLEEEKKKAEEEARRAAGEELKPDEKKTDNKNDKAAADEKEKASFDYYLPELEYSAAKENVDDGISYKLNYNLGLNLTTQVSYSDTNLKTSDDFDWNDVRSSMYNLKLPLSLSSLFNYGGNFFSVDNKFTYTPVFQRHPFMSEDKDYGYTESEIKKIKLSDLKTETRDVVNTNTVTLRPLIYYPVFSETNIAWNSSIRLYRRKFIGDADTEDWEEHYADWTDEESITVNSLSTDIRAKEWNNKLSQSLRLEMVMPPLKKKYTATLSLGVPYVSASVSSGFEEIRQEEVAKMNDKDKEKYQNQKWKKSPLNQTLTVTLFDSKLKLSENFTYNMEDDNPDSLKLTASLFGVQLAYVQSYVLGYEFDAIKGWYIPEEKRKNDEKEFLPYSFSLSYSNSGKAHQTWFNRLSYTLGLNTSIVADLLRPTNSYFLFTPSVKFSIFEFCDITFSASSRNSVLYWYFHNDEGDLKSEWGGFPGNILKDLLDSFRFDNEEKRQNSGFKLKSFNMTVSHDLHDWKANMTMKIEPRIITENGKKMYDFKPYITIGVVWNPMESMKTTITDDYGEWKLE